MLTATRNEGYYQDGLISSHCYSVLGIKTVVVAHRSVTLVKLRNPHGQNPYTGPWSPSSSEWSPEIE